MITSRSGSGSQPGGLQMCLNYSSHHAWQLAMLAGTPYYVVMPLVSQAAVIELVYRRVLLIVWYRDYDYEPGMLKQS